MIKRVENLIPGDVLDDCRTVESRPIVNGTRIEFEVSFRGKSEGIKAFRFGHQLAGVNIEHDCGFGRSA
jgi:hypothetical protein